MLCDCLCPETDSIPQLEGCSSYTQRFGCTLHLALKQSRKRKEREKDGRNSGGGGRGKGGKALAQQLPPQLSLDHLGDKTTESTLFWALLSSLCSQQDQDTETALTHGPREGLVLDQDWRVLTGARIIASAFPQSLGP